MVDAMMPGVRKLLGTLVRTRLLFDEAPEEAVRLPFETRGGVRDPQRKVLENGIELRRCREVNRLAQIVGRRVIAPGVPIFKDFLLWSARPGTAISGGSRAKPSII